MPWTVLAGDYRSRYRAGWPNTTNPVEQAFLDTQRATLSGG
jgi:hypothetical protein